MSDGDHDIEIAGRTVTIRPMCHADAALEQEFVRGLSAESRHYRFLGAVRELTPEEVRQFCDIDGHRSMAFVALVREEAGATIIGVSRYAPNADSAAREIAITVADAWQNKGIGTRLARALIQHAREHGIRKLYSIDLSDNTHMRMLAADLGMKMSPDPDDAHQVVYSLNLADLPVSAASHAVTSTA
jgi:GNAT superfamily N-acetyltransferase